MTAKMTNKNTVPKSDRKDADKPEPAEKTVTVKGLKVTVSTTAMKRLDVIESLDDVTSERNPFAIISVFKAVFGEDQYEKIKDHLEEKHGVPEIEHMQEFFTAAVNKAAPNS